MSQEQVIQIEVNEPAARLDQLLVKEIPTLSRSQLQKLIRQGRVFLSRPQNSQATETVRPGTSVQPGVVITLLLTSTQAPTLQPEAVPLDIVYEDDHLIVVNKPSGMVVHPAPGHTRGTLVNALLAHYPDITTMTQTDAGAGQRPGIVHRLDRDTSGLIIIARTPAALQNLQRQFKSRTVEKIYLALVFGRPEAPEGIIDVPLGRDPRHRQRFAPRARGKSARTH